MTVSAVDVNDASTRLATVGAGLSRETGWLGWLWPRRPTHAPEAPALSRACHRRMSRLYGTSHLLDEFDGATGP